MRARLARGWTALPYDPLAHRARWGLVVNHLAPTMDLRTEPQAAAIGAGGAFAALGVAKVAQGSVGDVAPVRQVLRGVEELADLLLEAQGDE